MTNLGLLLGLKIASLTRVQRKLAYDLFNEQTSCIPDNFLEQLNRRIPGFNSDFTHEQKVLDDCQRLQITCISFMQLEYPFSDNLLFDKPAIIFTRGDFQTCFNKHYNLAIVGSRNADQFGFELTMRIATEVGQQAVITSGLALGIDSAAHQGALMANSRNNCIAVLAHGLDQVYPRSNLRLANRILDAGGCLVSQFAPGIAPLPHQFLVRNASIAALAQAVLVIQAGLRSGSLATARHALENGKDVLAIPGRVDDPRSEGTNRLIQQGAHLVRSAIDVCQIMGITSSNKHLGEDSAKTVQISAIARQIVSKLKEHGQLHYHELLEQLEKSERVHEELLQLELDGIVQRRIGNYLALA